MSATQSLVIILGSLKLKKSETENHPGEIEDSEVIWNSDDFDNFRSNTTRNSPVTCAFYFDLVSRSVLNHLFGIQLDSKKNYF